MQAEAHEQMRIVVDQSVQRHKEPFDTKKFNASRRATHKRSRTHCPGASDLYLPAKHLHVLVRSSIFRTRGLLRTVDGLLRSRPSRPGILSPQYFFKPASHEPRVMSLVCGWVPGQVTAHLVSIHINVQEIQILCRGCRIKHDAHQHVLSKWPKKFE